MAELTESGPGAPRGSRYADQRPYVVIEQLDELNGPIAGQIVLSRRLDWSGRARYDLDNPRRLASMYETVLREATITEDLQLWLDGPTLRRLWGGLVLPPQVRLAWESKHPVLAESRRAAA
ncbi:hypothetical protein [Actinoplanes flavus]|uniref:Uncharacterized protein n=1 Tax=Actinoplanes flavus TaxID=2820290 RepID=A0ABS3UH79_9ACTN|nr:hypothetical protein [Actinoplanes flavus]MBO3738132.1 hypothetical protein [Actinoplanes flavus]